MPKTNPGFAGGTRRSDEEQRWAESLQALLADNDPASLSRWLNQYVGQLDVSFSAALVDLSKRLLGQTSLASTQLIFRLSLLTGELVRRVGTVPWANELVQTLKRLEEDGIGPRPVEVHGPADVYKRVFNYRGCCLAEHGEYTAAIEHFNTTLDTDPHFAPAYCNRARAYVELNRLEEAWADCEALRSFDPDYPMGQATAQLVATLRRLKASRTGTQAEIAEEHGLLELLRRYDRPAKVGEFTESIGRQTNPLEMPEAPRSDATPAELNHLGVVRGRSGDYQGAIAAFDQALHIDPEYDETRYNRGKAYQLTGAFEQAIADFSYIIERNPEDLSAYHLRAQVYRAIGNVAAAEADERQERRLRR